MSISSRILVLSATGARALCAALEASDVSTTTVASFAAAEERLNVQLFSALFIEISRAEEAEKMTALREYWPELVLVAFGAEGASDMTLQARQCGALEYLAWPIESAAVERTLRQFQRAAETDYAEPPPPPMLGASLLGRSPPMLAVRETIARVAAGTASVILRGETGTGKELVARAIHAQSSRQNQPFVKLNAPALPDNLFESELFGYEKGAFTGATGRKPGRVELAESGTLFIDEIAELSPPMQAKLLRLIQDREYERLGGTRTLQADLRFISATHRDLEHMIDSKSFREDLFYRLNVVTIWLPPLRARREDIALIAEHYLERFREANHKPNLRFEPRSLHLLQMQRWPGNVRQLVNFVERLVVMAEGQLIEPDDLRREFDEQTAFATQSVPRPEALAQRAEDDELDFEVLRSSASIPSAVRPLREEVRRAERYALEKALRASGGNRTQAARLLGVSRRTLYAKLDEHELS